MLSTSTPSHKKLRISPRDIAFSDFLLRKITPWAEDLRKELFGQAKAPFTDENSWVEWLKEQSVMPEHDVKIIELLEEMRIKTGLEFKAPLLTLPYAIKDMKGHWVEWQKVIRAPYGSKNYMLAKETERMAKATGFQQVQLVMHILTGTKPLFQRVVVTRKPNWMKLSERNSLTTVYVSVDIYASDFNVKELQVIYNNVRPQLTAKAGKIDNEKHAMVYNLVKQAGGPWKRKGSLAKWEMIRKQVNKHWVKKPFMTERAIRNTFRHYEVELDKAFQASQQPQHNYETFIRAIDQS